MLPLALMGAGMAASIGGSIFGGLFGSSAEKKRAAAIQAAGQQGAADILRAGKDANKQIGTQLGVARGDLSPFAGYGQQAGDSLMSILLGGKTPAGLLQASDLFKFQSDLGSRNIDRELSARGLYGSGAGLETLARFNNQLVGEEGQRMYDRLFGLTQLGGNAASNMAQLTNQSGLQQGQNIYNSGLNAAQMKFDAALGSANARANSTQMLGNIGQQSFGAIGDGLMTVGSMGLGSMMGGGKGLEALFGGGGGSGGGMTSQPGNAYGFTSIL